ncbi:hypothetical protein P3G55_09965 [Leptospira sp. 96542]|nr:hypothetical protein [Leptospira sp. 96542]
MVRKLLILTVFSSCSYFQPADPSFVERALQNETDMGFISREFFQILVEIPVSSKEISGTEKREDCKKKAYILREKTALPFLLDVQRGKYQFASGFSAYAKSGEGKDRFKSNSTPSQTTGANTTQPSGVQNTISPMGSTTPSNTQSGTTTDGKENLDKVSGKSVNNGLEYSHNFGWFFDNLKIYKEDYSNKRKCTFLFRNIQSNLYDLVEKTPIN